jgi:dTDP-4-amino-4,6-dideoxygalactose transaminase
MVKFNNTQKDLAMHEYAFRELGKSGQYLDGKEIAHLEDIVARACNRKFGIAVGSCSDALFFSLLAKDIGVGDEVIITSFSYPASVNCVLRTGATPRFADIDPETFMMKLDDDLVTSKTKAIIITHLFGQVMDFEAVKRFAKIHNLFVIEDAAQSLGGSWNNEVVGSLGDLSCLSFDPVKPVGSITTGGMILTDYGHHVNMFGALRNQGKNPDTGEYMCVGYNSRMPEIAAFVLRDRIETELIKRSSIYARTLVVSEYNSHLQEIEEITLPSPPSTLLYEQVWTKYVIRAQRRDELKTFLEEAGIETRIHYRYPLSHLSYIWSDDSPTNALRAGTEVSSLPLHSTVMPRDIEYIAKKIREFYGH